MIIKDYYDKYLKSEHEGICENCRNETKFFDLSHGYRNYCSRSCVSRSEKEKEKMKETLLKNYGVDSAHKSKVIRDKYIDTMLNRYGVSVPLKSKRFRDKSIDTCKKKYGVEYTSQIKNSREKFKATCLQKYGVEHPLKSEKIKQKIRHTVQDIYGVDWITKSPEIRKKIENTLYHNFGVRILSNSSEIIQLQKNGNLNKYGVHNWSMTPEGCEFHRNDNIKRIENQKLLGEPLVPTIGLKERECLNELESFLNIQILRNVKVHGYFPDGLIFKLKIVIEFDENHHNQNQHKLHDQKKDFAYRYYGYIPFRIPEEKWEQNKKDIIQKLKELCILIEICEETNRVYNENY